MRPPWDLPGLSYSYYWINSAPVRHYQFDGNGRPVEVDWKSPGPAVSVLPRSGHDAPPPSRVEHPDHPAARGFHIFGSAAPFNSPSRLYYDDRPGAVYPAYRRQFQPGCFEDSLRRVPVVLMAGHDGPILARTTDGSLRVSEAHGALVFDAEVQADVQWKRDILEPLAGCATGASTSCSDDDFRWEHQGGGGVLKVVSRARLSHVALITPGSTFLQTKAWVNQGTR